jgi:hypothetical protein
MYNFQQNAVRKDAERERAVYEKLLAKYDTLSTAADEGVFQVTVHTDSGTITIPTEFAKGRGIAIELAEVLSDWIIKIERNLNSSLEALGDEVKEDQNEKERKQGERNKEAEAARAQDAQLEIANAQTSTIPAS